MDRLEEMKKELEELERKKKAKEDVLKSMKERDRERKEIKSKLRELKNPKTTKILRGTAKAGIFAGRVLGVLGDKVIQPSQKQQPVRRVVRRAPVRRVVRRAPVRRVRKVPKTKRRPIQRRQVSDLDWYMRM